MKTKTQELQYLGHMLTATTPKDKSRLKAILVRLKAIQKSAGLTRAIVWLRQRYCSHVGYLEDMQRLSESQVTCPCIKCGKLLSAFCGLDLPMKWERRK